MVLRKNYKMKKKMDEETIRKHYAENTYIITSV
jgi:hypothetical protein